ncbi:MAG: hypothetical protein RJA26_472, partial [Actinomycetota bacterium]
VMRHNKNNNDDQPAKQSGNQRKRDKGGKDKQDSGKGKDHIEVAKVVTAESANALSSVIGKIAASTVAAHEAAGEPSPIVLTPVAGSSTESNSAGKPAAEKLLESVLDALPEPKAPGQGRRKPRRASSAGSAPSAPTE